jgi:excisionase family DNA binding protein
MSKADKDILTTADTAKLLGVSVRTAQLLIESGAVTSWKTPGGHRRVYRADVMALIDGGARSAPTRRSATVVVIGSASRLAVYADQFGQVPECTTEMYEDVLAALVTVGSIKPHAVIVDAAAGDADRVALLHSLAANPMLADSRVIVVGAESLAALPDRVVEASDVAEAVASVRASLRDEHSFTIGEGELNFPISLNERQRLVALEQTGLVDTPPEEAFDRLTWLAAQSLDTPIALLTLLTPTRQWFKSKVGLDLTETPRGWAFCNHTILQKQVFTVPDLADDPRFADNPAVKGPEGFRFYAGAPVLDAEGFVVGSLCVIDRSPRVLDERGERTILALAGLASDEVRLRALERTVRRTGQPAVG